MATAVNPFNGGQALSAEAVANGIKGFTGKTGAEVADWAQRNGLTQDQFAQVFGSTAQQVADTGYGTATGLVEGAKKKIFNGTSWVDSAAPVTASPGIVSNAMAASAPAPAPAPRPPPQQATVTNWNVDPSKTTQSLTQGIVNSDGVLMQQARGQGLMQANERGLINSSLGIGAAQGAVLDRAVDIGGRDANMYAQAGQFNANAANQGSIFNAGQANTWDNNQLERDFRSSERGAAQAFQAGETAKQQAFTSGENFKQQAFTGGQNKQQQDFNAAENAKQQALAASESTKQQAFTSAEKEKDRQLTIDQYKLDTATRATAAAVEQTYKTQLNNDNQLNDQYKLYVNALYNIDSDQNLGDEAKRDLKYQQAIAFESFAKIRNLKLDLDFSGQYARAASAPPAAPVAEPRSAPTEPNVV